MQSITIKYLDANEAQPYDSTNCCGQQTTRAQAHLQKRIRKLTELWYNTLEDALQISGTRNKPKSRIMWPSYRAVHNARTDRSPASREASAETIPCEFFLKNRDIKKQHITNEPLTTLRDGQPSVQQLPSLDKRQSPDAVRNPKKRSLVQEPLQLTERRKRATHVTPSTQGHMDTNEAINR